jgi:Di-haem cytochrome c peroxidase
MMKRLGPARRLVGLSAMMVLANAWPGASVPVDTEEQTSEVTEVLQGPDGRQLFNRETFGGNGRTCRTCHSTATGTTSVADVAHRINEPSDPLFVHDGLDDDGAGTTRIEAHATIRMTIPLPPGITLADAPGATSVKVNRGIPTTRNTPALDPVLLADGRAPTIQDQALGAILDHFQNTRQPTAAELAAIAEFQQTNSTFFSSSKLRQFAGGGPPPELPEGHTAAEKRGRRFLVDVPFISVVHGTPVHHALSSIFHASPHGPHMVLTV